MSRLLRLISTPQIRCMILFSFFCFFVAFLEYSEKIRWEKVGQLESDLCVHDMVSIGDGQQAVMFPAEQDKLLESLLAQVRLCVSQVSRQKQCAAVRSTNLEETQLVMCVEFIQTCKNLTPPALLADLVRT